MVSPFQQASLVRAAREPGYALSMRRQQKESKYLLSCKAQNIEFYALPVETTGAWEEGASIVIARLGKALARATSQEEGECVKHLFGKLSVMSMK